MPQTTIAINANTITATISILPAIFCFVILNDPNKLFVKSSKIGLDLFNNKTLLKELEDYEWFPAVLRNYQTDYIGFIVSAFSIYQPFIDKLQSTTLPHKMFDLCSGSGEPAYSIFCKSKAWSSFTASDKFPRPVHFANQAAKYLQHSTDVMEMAFNSENTYTMFNAFHHFSEAQQISIINRMTQSNAKAYFVEILEPGLWFSFKILFTTTVGQVLLMPFVKPFSLKRLLFTYIIPINIITIATDGLISVFKSKSVEQYQLRFKQFGDTVRIYRLQKGFRTQIVIETIPQQ
ncbi:MAG: hypothetical protein V4613_04215 [Bacteroidota bacterium]